MFSRAHSISITRGFTAHRPRSSLSARFISTTPSTRYNGNDFMPSSATGIPLTPGSRINPTATTTATSSVGGSSSMPNKDMNKSDSQQHQSSRSQWPNTTVEQAKGKPAKEVSGMMQPPSTASSMLREKEQDLKRRGEPTAADIIYPTEAEGARMRQEEQGIKHPDSKPGEYWAPDYQGNRPHSATQVATAIPSPFLNHRSQGIIAGAKEKVAGAKHKIKGAAAAVKSVAHKAAAKLEDAATSLKDKTAHSMSVDSSSTLGSTTTPSMTSASTAIPMSSPYHSGMAITNAPLGSIGSAFTPSEVSPTSPYLTETAKAEESINKTAATQPVEEDKYQKLLGGVPHIPSDKPRPSHMSTHVGRESATSVATSASAGAGASAGASSAASDKPRAAAVDPSRVENKF